MDLFGFAQRSGIGTAVKCDGEQGHIKGGHRIRYGGYIMGPTRVRKGISDPCPFSLPALVDCLQPVA